jgi:hypothetical protein
MKLKLFPNTFLTPLLIPLLGGVRGGRGLVYSSIVTGYEFTVTSYKLQVTSYELQVLSSE